MVTSHWNLESLSDALDRDEPLLDFSDDYEVKQLSYELRPFEPEKRPSRYWRSR